MAREDQAHPGDAPAAPTASAGAPLTMVRPHLRDIPWVPFPAGYGIRPMRADEGALWLAVVRDAEKDSAMPDGAFEPQHNGDLASVPERCFLAVEAQGLAVGTISAWYYTFQVREYGLIHWVAVRPAHQGRGVGRAEVSFALRRLARWHDQALLNTQSRRLRAVQLYLDFGFVPFLDLPGAVETWRSVRDELQHPVLQGLTLG